MSQPTPPCVVEKVWGREEWFTNGEYCAKRLVVNPGYHCSMHRHLVKDETFIIEEGNGWAIVDDVPVELDEGDIVRVPQYAWHCFWCPAWAEGPLVMLEVSTHHDDADVERRSTSGPLTKPSRCPVPGEAPGG